MKPEEIQELRRRLLRQLMLVTGLLLIGSIAALFYLSMGDLFPPKKTLPAQLNPERRVILPDAEPRIYLEGNIDLVSGLHFGKGFKTVRAVCTACHSSQLITQNRATYQGWKDMILWMQATQGLQDLGEQEEEILEYLATYYAPEEIGRRANLEVEEWYRLED